MAQRIDHALVLNMHKAQGLTVENAITVMESGDRMLNNQGLAYVLASRACEGFELHIDNREAMINQLESNSGVQHSAIGVADSAIDRTEPKSEQATTISPTPQMTMPTDLAIETPELEKTRDFDIS